MVCNRWAPGWAVDDRGRSRQPARSSTDDDSTAWKMACETADVDAAAEHDRVQVPLARGLVHSVPCHAVRE